MSVQCRCDGGKALDVAANVRHRRGQSSANAMMVLSTLAAHPCFKTLDPESCRVLDRHCAWLMTPAGALVAGRAANDRGVYFVVTGRLREALLGARRDLVFTDIKVGSFFGELGALESASLSVSFFVVIGSTLAKMPSGVFVETVFTHRPLGEAVVATLVVRNRAMTHRVAEAAHVYWSRLPHVGPTRSRPLQGRSEFDAAVGHISGKHRRAQ
jgi:CRP-like cAMP-binding protein